MSPGCPAGRGRKSTGLTFPLFCPLCGSVSGRRPSPFGLVKSSGDFSVLFCDFVTEAIASPHLAVLANFDVVLGCVGFCCVVHNNSIAHYVTLGKSIYKINKLFLPAALAPAGLVQPLPAVSADRDIQLLKVVLAPAAPKVVVLNG